jgi:hypothetical protein
VIEELAPGHSGKVPSILKRDSQVLHDEGCRDLLLVQEMHGLRPRLDGLQQIGQHFSGRFMVMFLELAKPDLS